MSLNLFYDLIKKIYLNDFIIFNCHQWFVILIDLNYMMNGCEVT